MTFTCTRCGKCCVSSGKVIRTERRITERSFACISLAGGERFVAVLDPGMAKLFRPAAVEGACPFLRMQDKAAVCPVYGSRPAYCREFRCWLIRIRDKSGRMAGTVKGRRTLDTGDPDLRAVWDREVGSDGPVDDSEWISLVSEILIQNGYDVET